MNSLKDYVDWKLTHSDKTAVADGYPLILENCKKNKKMKDLKVYGNSVQDGTPSPENPIEVQSVGNLVTDESDVNFGKYKIPIVQESLDNEKNILTEGAFSNNVNCIYDNGIYTFTRTEAFPNRFSGLFNVNVQAGSKLYARCDRFEETYSGILGLQITYADATNTTMVVRPYSSNVYVTVTKDVKSMRLYLNTESVVGEYVKFKNLVICVDKQPTLTKQTHNVFVDEPLSSNDILDVKEHMELPKLTAKTTVFTTDTTTPPSKMYGKYIKK